MNTTLGVLVLAAASATAGAQDASWILVTTNTNGTTYEARAGTYTETAEMVSAIFRTTRRGDNTLFLDRIAVSHADCEAQAGMIVTMSLSGTVKFSNPFVFSGGNVASGMAEFLCGVRDLRRSNRNL